MGLDLGRDLATPRLSWRRLRVIIERLPPESALFREMHPEHVGWSVATHLMAAHLEALDLANWQRQGKPNAPRPKPVPRPGAKQEGQKYGTTAMSFSDADAWLAGDGSTFDDSATEHYV